LGTRRGFAEKSKARGLPLEQVFKRKRRCLLNGIEKSALLEEKKRESIAICRTTLRPSQWRLRLRVTRHTVHFSVGWKAAAGECHFVRSSFCLLSLGYKIKMGLK
jgi:hypothetical protein